MLRFPYKTRFCYIVIRIRHQNLSPVVASHLVQVQRGLRLKSRIGDMSCLGYDEGYTLATEECRGEAMIAAASAPNAVWAAPRIHVCMRAWFWWVMTAVTARARVRGAARCRQRFL